MNLTSRCKDALAQRLRELNPTANWIPGYCNYVVDVRSNLLPNIDSYFYQNEYADAAGGELQWDVRYGKKYPPKMHAAHSSSALVVNSFAPWKRHLETFELCGKRSFSRLRFEVKLPTPLRGTPPHLDFLGETIGSDIVAGESKATEYLQEHPTVFPPSYDSVSWLKCVSPYIAMMRQLKEIPSTFLYVDAAQLVKHAFGLSTNFGDRELVLMYLFWEPANHNCYREFGLHREELQRFCTSVNSSSVAFAWKSYPELWREWSQDDQTWLRQHSKRLLDRYDICV
jgi:hypothetical protein